VKKVKYDNIIKKLKYLSNPKSIEGMAKYGITPKKTYGVSIPDLRKFVIKIQKMNSSCSIHDVIGIYKQFVNVTQKRKDFHNNYAQLLMMLCINGSLLTQSKS